jgi:hypothetical protein
MYPERLKYQQSSDNLLTESWSFSLKIKQILKIYSFLLLLMIFSMAMIAGFPSPVSNAIAWILGIFSMILSVFQFIPQIHQTFKHKVRKNTICIIKTFYQSFSFLLGNRSP